MKGVVRIIEATIGLILVVVTLSYLTPIDYQEKEYPYFNITVDCDPSCVQKVLNVISPKGFVVNVKPYYYKRICVYNNRSYSVENVSVTFNVPSWAKDCNASIQELNALQIVFKNNYSSGTVVANVSLPFDDVVAFDENGELRVEKNGTHYLIEIPEFEFNTTRIVYVFEDKRYYYQLANPVKLAYKVENTEAKRVKASFKANLSPGESRCFIIECSQEKYAEGPINGIPLPYYTSDSVILGEAPAEIKGKECENQEMILMDGTNWIRYVLEVCAS